MAGSGLQQLFELIYAHYAVVHMLTYKAVARAVWAHLIIDATLNALVLSNAMDTPCFVLHKKKQNLHWKRLQLISALEMLIFKKPVSSMKT